MSYSTVQAALVSVVSGVSGVVNVHGYLRRSNTIQKRIDEFVDPDTEILHTWMLTRVAAPSVGNLDGDVTRRHTFHIHGYYSINDEDESEVTFQNLVEAVLDELNDNRQVTEDGDAAVPDSSQLLSFEDEMFAGVLCHHAIIENVVEDSVDP